MVRATPDMKLAGSFVLESSVPGDDTLELAERVWEAMRRAAPSEASEKVLEEAMRAREPFLKFIRKNGKTTKTQLIKEFHYFSKGERAAAVKALVKAGFVSAVVEKTTGRSVTYYEAIT